MRVRLALVAFALSVGLALAADEVSTEAFVRAISGQPDVTVSHGTEGDGPYTEWRKNGVFYRLTKTSTGDQLIGDDESGRGAVICTWSIELALRDALEACPADQFSELRADLDRDIPAMETFIMANSVLPLTPAQLRAQATRLTARAPAANPAPAQRTCAGGDVGELLKFFDAMGAPGRREMIDKLLAVPRWPVLNPCF